MVFSVSRDSLSGVLVLAVVAGEDGGMRAVTVRERVSEWSCVSMQDGEVTDVLLSLSRQGFLEQCGVRFAATEKGCRRVQSVFEAVECVRGAGLAGSGGKCELVVGEE